MWKNKQNLQFIESSTSNNIFNIKNDQTIYDNNSLILDNKIDNKNYLKICSPSQEDTSEITNDMKVYIKRRRRNAEDIISNDSNSNWINQNDKKVFLKKTKITIIDKQNHKKLSKRKIFVNKVKKLLWSNYGNISKNNLIKSINFKRISNKEKLKMHQSLLVN